MADKMTPEQRRNYWCPDLTGALIIKDRNGKIIAGQEIADRMAAEQARNEEKRITNSMREE